MPQKKTDTSYSIQKSRPSWEVKETGWVDTHPSEVGKRPSQMPLGAPSIHAILRLLDYGKK